jgi:hypothetical protein
MSVSKLFKKGERRLPDSTPKPEPAAILKEIIEKRIPPELFEPEIVEQIIIYSGGVLRELIRISNECCRICLRLIRRNPENKEIKINRDIFQQAITKISLDFDMRIGTDDYEILETTYREFRPNDPKEQRFLDLLHGLYVLEYRNAELWYDIHPIVTELLEQRGHI